VFKIFSPAEFYVHGQIALGGNKILLSAAIFPGKKKFKKRKRN